MITKINEDLKQAMRDKDVNKLNVLRALKNEITNTSLRKGSVNEPVTDIEITNLIRKEVSKRQDSISSFINAKRDDLILKETNEIEILNQYLPTPLTFGELDELIDQAINETMAITKKDMGRVIKRVQELVEGRMDNSTISKRIGERLS